MKTLNLFSLLLLGFCLSGQASAQHRSARCDGCTESQYRNLAASTASSAANAGITIYIGDFNRHLMRKYFVLNDNPRAPIDPIAALQGAGILAEDATDYDLIDIEEQQGNTRSVNIVSLQLTQYEFEGFTNLDWFVNYLESLGINTTRGSTRGNPFGAPRVIGNFPVPASSGFVSAFDVIGIPAFTRQLGRLASEDSPLVASSFNAIGFTGTIFEAVDLNFSFEFTFEDGSSGLWTFDPRGDLDAIPGFFQDSEGNDIPQTAADVPGMTSIFNGGINSGNATRTGDRVRSLGFGLITIGGGGSSGGGGSCSFTCDEHSCTFTCRVH